MQTTTIKNSGKLKAMRLSTRLNNKTDAYFHTADKYVNQIK